MPAPSNKGRPKYIPRIETQSNVFPEHFGVL
jgi:hypothetical protein